MKAIAGFDKYFISETGEVTNSRTKRILKYDINSAGYRRVTLSQDGEVTRLFVHRLVALHYLPNPGDLPWINHKDSDKLNNNSANLEWCTPSHNRLHAFKSGTSLVGEGHCNSKWTEVTVRAVCTLIDGGMSRGDIIAATGVNRYLVDDLRRGKAWTHVTKEYKFSRKCNDYPERE